MAQAPPASYAWLANALAAVLLLLLLSPLLWMLQVSFRLSDDVVAEYLLFHPTLENYTALWTGTFPASFVNSAVTSSISTALSLLLGVPAAYTLARWPFRSNGHVVLWIHATRMAPPIAFTIPFFLAFKFAGLSNTRTGLILIYLTFNLALVIWTMRSFFEGVPRSLEEAAWIDGCGVWDTFLRVVTSLSAPALAATGILLRPILERLLLCPDPDPDSRHDRTSSDRELHAIRRVGVGQDRCGGTLVMLPVVAFAILVRSWLVSGLMAGAVKE